MDILSSIPTTLFSAARPNNPSPLRLSGAIRRPIVPSNPEPPKIPQNPLRTPRITQNPLSDKLFLSSKLSPPPPPPPPPPETLEPVETKPEPEPVPPPDASRFVQKGKIFVGNLPLWIKKQEIGEFFRQFGPLKSVVLVKGHEDPERNVGFCFVIFGGPTAEEAAGKAVEFDGVEFHGRALTVRIDNGRRLREREEGRERWVRGEVDRREFRSQWHEERDAICKRFRKVLDSQPENWQAVVNAFERIPKV